MAPRRKMSENEKKQQELVNELLTVANFKGGDGLNSLLKDIIAQMVGGVLQGVIDDSLGYDRYDSENKETTSSRNGYGKKTIHISYSDAEVQVPRDREGEFDLVIIEKYQKTVNAEIEN